MKYNISSDYINNLYENEIFVFGSNKAGRHGKGAAKTARMKFGAEYGVGIGRTGDCYAIPTKDYSLNVLPLSEIEIHVNEFLTYAIRNPKLKFLVTEIGCGYAGYYPSEIAPLFKDVISLEISNVYLPSRFIRFIK